MSIILLEPDRIDEQARQIAALLRRKGGDEAAVLGHSYGCVVGTVLAELYPDLVTKLVLVSPPSEFGAKPPWYMRNRVGLWVALFMIRALLSNPAKFHELSSKAFYVKSALSKEDAEVYRRSMLTEGVKRACYGFAKAFARGGVSSLEYGKITLPSLVIAGVEDEIVSCESVEKVANSIPNAQFRSIRECGHCSPEERPEEVLSLLSEFLSGV